MSGKGTPGPLLLTATSDSLASVAESIKNRIVGSDPFCLWLTGDLGAGKTTFTGHLLRAFGLSSKVPVTSPTFTYVNEYEIKGHWFAHMDLYRGGPHLHPEDLGLVDKAFRGFFVEWPEQIPASPVLKPTHWLDITFTNSENERKYALRTMA